MQLAAAVLAGGLAVAACGSLQLGAAAVTGQGRITSAALTNQVANLNAAYRADKGKGLKPQRPRGQAPQQVLTWLLTFQIFDKLAAQHGISVTTTQIQRQLSGLQAQAAQQKVTTQDYVSAAGAVPPDLVPQIGRYFAILQAFENRLDGGKQPTAQSAQAAIQARVAHAQCLAAKNLNINVNPQYGAYDYSTFSVVSAQSKLAAASSLSPGPRASASPSAKPRLTPPC
jgi:peptidyl-prolyl cis-trans isomerase SurA